MATNVAIPEGFKLVSNTPPIPEGFKLVSAPQIQPLTEDQKAKSAGTDWSDVLSEGAKGFKQGLNYATGKLLSGATLGLSDKILPQEKPDFSEAPTTAKAINTGLEFVGSLPTSLGILNKVKGVAKLAPMSLPIAGAIESGIASGVQTGDIKEAGKGALIGGTIGTALKGLGYVGKGTKHLLGLSTGTSADSIGQAYNAGKRGSGDFLKNLRGKEKMENVLDDVQEGVKQLKQNAQKQYSALKPEVLGDKTRLDVRPIKQAFNEVKQSLLEGGPQFKSGGTTERTLKEVGQAVDEFMLDQPNHNVLGMDSFKKRIGDMLQDIDYKNDNARRIASTVYNTTKTEIGKQAPRYYEMTSKYADAIDDITDIRKAFSLKNANGTNVDTALRKIQSVMRNNVNTNYGKRLELLEKLSNVESIKDKVAGQMLRDILPKGMSRTLAGGIGGAGILTANPMAIPVLVSSSPRVVGEMAYKAGQASRLVKPAGILSAIYTALKEKE